MTNLKAILLASAFSICSTAALAQTFNHYTTTDTERWVKGKDVKVTNSSAYSSSTSSASSSSSTGVTTLTDKDNPIVTFRGWGTTFNEQD